MIAHPSTGRSLNLKPQTFPFTFVPAPMAEITHAGFRRLLKEFSPGLVLWSEMLSASAVVCGAFNNGTFVERHPFDDPFVYQIAGNSPDIMALATERLSASGCFAVEINMGCSAPDILKKGWCARLLTDFDLARCIVRECRAACRTRLAVKMRSGFAGNDADHLARFAGMLVDEGVDFITLHPRFAKLSFRRSADWTLVQALAGMLPVPVIGNGDITSPQLAMKRLRESGATAVMIGREAVKSPWIFSVCDALREESALDLVIDVEETFVRGLEYIRLYLPEHMHKSRGHRFCFYFSKNARFSHELYTKLRRTAWIDDMIGIVRSHYSTSPHERIMRIQARGGSIVEGHSP